MWIDVGRCEETRSFSPGWIGLCGPDQSENDCLRADPDPVRSSCQRELWGQCDETPRGRDTIGDDVKSNLWWARDAATNWPCGSMPSGVVGSMQGCDAIPYTCFPALPPCPPGFNYGFSETRYWRPTEYRGSPGPLPECVRDEVEAGSLMCAGKYGICCERSIETGQEGSSFVSSEHYCSCRGAKAAERGELWRYTWLGASETDWRVCDAERACCSPAYGCQCRLQTFTSCQQELGKWHSDKFCEDVACEYGACCGCGWCCTTCSEQSCFDVGGKYWAKNKWCNALPGTPPPPGSIECDNSRPTRCVEGRWSGVRRSRQNDTWLLESSGVFTMDQSWADDSFDCVRSVGMIANRPPIFGISESRWQPTASGMWSRTISNCLNYYGAFVARPDDMRWEAYIVFNGACKGKPC